MYYGTRSGIIPYSIINEKYYFCLGIDRDSGDIGDFGGGFSKRKDKTRKNCAMRELKEESLGIFNIKKFDIYLELKLDRETIYFVQFDLNEEDMIKTKKIFDIRELNRSSSEMKDIIWINKDDFYNLIHNEHDLYSRTYKVLRKKLNLIYDYFPD